ncbi:MAG: bifunctional fucokinase/L-fucose-1-P-guanylyltransferase [Verrucomicrobia subdivision 3 bacterium]|nr:bifunctional fucokinase/L-fucose-1-P-guanylyltransferase [Limisphaerales bacterium]
MVSQDVPIQFLLTLPPRMAVEFETLEHRRRPDWFACSDSSGSPLGSGGGTANLLVEAWRQTGPGRSLSEWLGASRKLMLHSGGQSRRLPAYAPIGKLLMPVPAFRWSRGQRLDQTLLDLQLGHYARVLAHGGSRTVAMLVSGDTLIRLPGELPAFPDVDVLGLGMWGTPEKAKDFGVFFTPRGAPNELACFLQKPAPARTRELAQDYHYLFDTGMWLLSERAVRVLLARCGWDEPTAQFKGGRPASYEFYSRFALALGTHPVESDPLVRPLTCAVVPLNNSEFYHFGTSAQMIESVSELQNLVLDESTLGASAGRRHPDQYLQNTQFACPLRRDENHTLWIENSYVPASWQIACEHVLTGIPANDWKLQLEPRVCLDFVPIGAADYCIRHYGFRDRFSGNLGDPNTKWFDRPALDWFTAHGLDLQDCGISAEADLQLSALFPVLPTGEIDGAFLEWLFQAKPASRPDFAQRWRDQPRLSAQQLLEQTNIRRIYDQRTRLRNASIAPLMKNFRRSIFFRLDLESTARSFARTELPLPELAFDDHDEPLAVVHDQMFRSASLRHRQRPDWAQHEANAFAQLRDLIVREAQLSPAHPRRNVLDDQIIWARSPVRLDLAGGWTDTPPYCIEFGGRVLNVAANLNGQPPVQVFAKVCERPELVVRSIDLGVEERLCSYEELDTFTKPGSAFALAKAAFALAGFLPRFQADGGFASLEKQLRDFGGGIELSLLAAAPKGSGLGTSSILAATVLAALGDLCGLNWDRNVLFTRTLALEQMLTTGGGWQDQAGGLYRGIKMVETAAGLTQKPTLSWLPDHLFGPELANLRILLYYTGVTRLAKNILSEIVRGIFLNSPSHLGLIEEIGANAKVAGAAIQQCDYDQLCAAIRNSWRLNQRLDAGTNPAPIAAILASVNDYLAAAKLLGAGGGGYLLMFAKDETAAARIRRQLTDRPPNPRARFVSFSLSDTGLQVTRS